MPAKKRVTGPASLEEAAVKKEQEQLFLNDRSWSSEDGIPRFYCIMHIETETVVYFGKSQHSAATNLVPGTVFGTGLSKGVAKQWASLRARRWKAAKKSYPQLQDWNVATEAA